jgi:hypothetical protein
VAFETNLEFVSSTIAHVTGDEFAQFPWAGWQLLTAAEAIVAELANNADAMRILLISELLVYKIGTAHADLLNHLQKGDH